MSKKNTAPLKRVRRKGRPRRRSRAPVHKAVDPLYEKLYGLVDAGIRDMIAMHPEYIADGIDPIVVQGSASKRVAGIIRSYVAQARGVARRKPTAKLPEAEQVLTTAPLVGSEVETNDP